MLALDEGQGSAAQRILTEKQGHLITFEERARSQLSQKGPDLDATNLSRWKQDQSDWYGVDAEMTKASYEIDRSIRQAGILRVGTSEYFDAINAAMSERYPGRVNASGGGGGGGGGSRRDGTYNGRIPASIAQGWRRMGIDMDDLKVVQRMMKNRERAVQKGILTQHVNAGPVKT